MSTNLAAKRTTSLPNDQDASGRSLGVDELILVTETLRSGTLTSTKGTMVANLEAEFAELLNLSDAIACSSGTTAVHAAIAAINPEPGDEIITSPITDMGAIAPILYQGAVPVFADVDPITCNVTAATIEAQLSRRTRAIVVTHLFGRPVDMEAVMLLANQHGIPVVEDCAQAFLARSSQQLVGTIGSIGCFSLQQGKHITSGEGGIVVTDDAALAKRVRLFVNKAWDYGSNQPDHEFLALNGRMSELQGSVALAQLTKLHDNVAKRIATAEHLTQRLNGVPGISCPTVDGNDVHTYWKYALHVDADIVPGGPDGLAQRIRDYDIAATPRYIRKPAFECRVIRDQQTFGNSRFPFSLARPEAVDYSPERYPGTYAGLRSIFVLPLNERYEPHHVERVAEAIKAEAQR